MLRLRTKALPAVSLGSAGSCYSVGSRWNCRSSTVDGGPCSGNGTQVPCGYTRYATQARGRACTNERAVLWEGQVGEIEPNAALIFKHRDTAAALRAIRRLSGHRQTAEFQQQFTEPCAFFEIHIDEFKCHRLRTSATNDSLRLDRAYAVRKTEAEHRSGSKVSVTRSDAAAKVQLWNREPDIFAQVGRSCG